VVVLIGKGGHIRTVPVPQWVKAALDQDREAFTDSTHCALNLIYASDVGKLKKSG
jgi:hypothetical protein